MKSHRVATGILGLDPLIEGGFPSGKSYLLTGAAGTGKSIFCMQFLLKGLADGEKAVYVSVDVKPNAILDHGTALGWDLGKYVKTKQLLILDASAYFLARAGTREEVGGRVEDQELLGLDVLSKIPAERRPVVENGVRLDVDRDVDRLLTVGEALEQELHAEDAFARSRRAGEQI